VRLLALPLVATLTVGCGPGAAKGTAASPSASLTADVLPDVRTAKDRPPVVLVMREGDPTGAIAVAVTTDDDVEASVALAGVVEARLVARGLVSTVTPSWDGYRATVLVDSAAAAHAATDAVREVLAVPIEEKDVVAAKKKLAALAQRPLRDAALGRWARCVGSPYAPPERAGKTYDDLSVAKVEAWRAAAHSLGHTSFAVAAPPVAGEEVASAIAKGPPWKTGAEPRSMTTSSSIEVDVIELAGESTPAIYATLDLGSSSAAVATAEALGDPHGALATRLANLEVPFRLREVAGTAHTNGGCVGVVIEATSAAAANGVDVAARVADAVALVHVEADARLGEAAALRDGRSLARRAGDAREAAERAAWWALAPAKESAPKSFAGSVTLAMPARRTSPKDKEAIEPPKETVAAAIERSTQAWRKPVAEGRVRVEPGQGEAWLLVASPCGTDSEGETDAGLTALFTVAAAELAKATTDARVEPWLVADGAGLLVHGPSLPGETPAMHVRRLADIAGRSFAAEPLTPAALSRARGSLLRRDASSDGVPFAALANALAPNHPSWVNPFGREEVLARSADAAAIARAQALRAGPLRIAVLANADAAQAEAAQRAVDRWVDRKSGEARSCKLPETAPPPKPGTYAVEPRGGASPEAYLAFPFAAGDEAARAAATMIAGALEGDGGLLEKALGGSAALARSSSARVLGFPRAPALVVRIVSTQAQLDPAVMQTRALVDRLRQGGLPQADFDRAKNTAARTTTLSALDPRARVVATWRGEPIPPAAPRVRAATVEDVRAFAQKHLVEDSMVVIAVRPGRAR